MWIDQVVTGLPADVPDGDIAESGIAGSAYLENFDAASEVAWCELIRDVVALANSGGGRLIVRQAVPGSADGLGATQLSAAAILERLAQYTDSPFDDVQVRATESAGRKELEIVVGAADFPIGFIHAAQPGQAGQSASQEQIFPAGSFYFRRGGRSEPATSSDLQAFSMRLVRRVRRRWLRGVRRVVSAPVESLVAKRRTHKAAASDTISTAKLRPVRIVTDPNAPALQPQDVDRLYPWRQKDLVRELNSRLGRRALNSYDIQAVRRHHQLDERPDFVFNLPGAGRRYSPAVADWIMEQFAAAPQFFQQARIADHEMLKLRRQKPK